MSGSWLRALTFCAEAQVDSRAGESVVKPWAGIGGRFWGSIVLGFIAAIYWALYSDNRVLAIVAAIILGTTLIVGLLVLRESSRVD